MRIPYVAALAACLSAPALAADFDAGPLRGPLPPQASPVINWEGGYFGAFAGSTQGNFENAFALREPLAYMLRDLVVENEFGLSTKLNPSAKDATDAGYGVFAGYNIQMDEAVLGIEADFTRVRLKGTGTDSYARRFTASNGFDYNVLLAGQASAEISDFGTLRARAGITMGSFLPYVTGGIALGRATTSRTAVVDIVEQSPIFPYPVTGRLQDAKSIGPKETLALGYAAGAGVDVSVTPNVMLRAEYQYVHFNDVAGYRISVNSVRAGAGVKF